MRRNVGLGREGFEGAQIGAEAEGTCPAPWARTTASQVSSRHYSLPTSVLTLAPRIGGSIRFRPLLRLSASTGLPFRRMVSSVLATACRRVFPPCTRQEGSAGDESRATSDQHKPTDPRYLDNGHDAEGDKEGTGTNEQGRLSSHG